MTKGNNVEYKLAFYKCHIMKEKYRKWSWFGVYCFGEGEYFNCYMRGMLKWMYKATENSVTWHGHGFNLLTRRTLMQSKQETQEMQ